MESSTPLYTITYVILNSMGNLHLIKKATLVSYGLLIYSRNRKQFSLFSHTLQKHLQKFIMRTRNNVETLTLWVRVPTSHSSKKFPISYIENIIAETILIKVRNMTLLLPFSTFQITLSIINLFPSLLVTRVMVMGFCFGNTIGDLNQSSYQYMP